MDAWLELVPPSIAIIGIAIIDLFFPEWMIDSELKEYEASVGETNYLGLVDLVKSNMQGWQVTVDLLYTMLASFALMICRVLSGRFSRDRPVTWLLILLLFTNFMLSLISGIYGPSRVAIIPTRLLGMNVRKISTAFCYVVNILLIVAIAYEAIGFEGEGEQAQNGNVVR